MSDFTIVTSKYSQRLLRAVIREENKQCRFCRKLGNNANVKLCQALSKNQALSKKKYCDFISV